MSKFEVNLESLSSEKVNLISLIIGLILLIIGFFCKDNLYTILISIGTSIIASSVIAFLSARYLIHKNKIKDIMEKWGLEGIYSTRADMNLSSNKYLERAEKEIDIMALGMRSFRDAKGDLIKKKVKNGVRIRILTVYPESFFIAQREKDEKKVEGEIKRTIDDLIVWVKELQNVSPNINKVQLKTYNTYPLESYLRIDDHIFIGPNMYKKLSQQTISYEFKGNSEGFQYYNKYFNDLWEDKSFCQFVNS